MAKCLVTGAAGFVGHHLVRELLYRGHDVTGVDDFSTGREDRLPRESDKFRFYEGQIQHQKMSRFCNIDYVFHQAAIPRVPISFEKPRHVLDNNFNSTTAALEVARRNGATMIYASSSSIYGNSTKFPTPEDAPKKCMSPYALSKWLGEELCEQFWEDFDVPYVALRYHNVYGPGMAEGGYATAIKIWLEQAEQGKALTVTGDGEQERDFTHVYDVVRANIAAMDCEYSGAFNICSSRPRKILDVANMVSEEITHIEARKEPKKTHGDNSFAKGTLGWEPHEDFEQRIKELL